MKATRPTMPTVKINIQTKMEDVETGMKVGEAQQAGLGPVAATAQQGSIRQNICMHLKVRLRPEQGLGLQPHLVSPCSPVFRTSPICQATGDPQLPLNRSLLRCGWGLRAGKGAQRRGVVHLTLSQLLVHPRRQLRAQPGRPFVDFSPHSHVPTHDDPWSLVCLSALALCLSCVQ